MVIALAVGLAHGVVWQSAAPDLAGSLDDFETVITDQRQFERALVTEAHGSRLFKDLTVHPRWVSAPGGGPKLVHIVAGLYWNGQPRVEGERQVARWAPACYVAPTPYLPLSSPGSFASVREYLQSLGGENGVRFSYAWWWWATRPMFISICASLVLVGGVWPSLINLLTFGTLTRPAEERGASLWRVKRVPHAVVPAPAPPFTSSGAPLGAHDGELEAILSGAAPAATEPPPAPRPLLLDPVTAASVPQPDDRHFGAGRSDFYPTELHAESESDDQRK